MTTKDSTQEPKPAEPAKPEPAEPDPNDPNAEPVSPQEDLERRRQRAEEQYKQ